MLYGYIGKMLFVDLSSGKIEERPLTEELAKNFVGGYGIGAKILYDEMPAKCDPFSEDSMIGYVIVQYSWSLYEWNKRIVWQPLYGCL